MCFFNARKDTHIFWNSCQLITRKQGNSSNFLDFKGVYPFCRITKYAGIIEQSQQINAIEIEF